ncbi:MAG TPA: energy transducer TonB [Sphingomonas sp.]|nr:energy transducer TonB [Sphingomonas sp.]
MIDSGYVQTPGARLAGAGGALAATALLVAALWIGLAVRERVLPEAALATFDLAPAPVPPPVPEQPSATPNGAAAPAHRTARPMAIEAPPPIVRVDLPVIAAPIAAAGRDPMAGAADNGPGTGAGGVGPGLGAGGSGDGTGAGLAVSARHVSGTIGRADYPREARKAGLTGVVIVTLSVGADGRVTGCAIARSSGTTVLDETTCRLARARFRYTPARAADGRAVTSLAGWKQEWWFDPR